MAIVKKRCKHKWEQLEVRHYKKNGDAWTYPYRRKCLKCGTLRGSVGFTMTYRKIGAHQ